MLARMRLLNYKGFSDYTVHFKSGSSFLIGPNNAGKSTIINALRLCSGLLSLAKRRKPEFGTKDEKRDRSVAAFSITSAPTTGFVSENVQHEFREVESRIELHFRNKAALYVIWPLEGNPYFYIEQIPGAQPSNLRVVKSFYSTMGVVQSMVPLERDENLLSETHVRDNLGTRLSSRHFRNQLYYRRESDPSEYGKLHEFLLQHTPEIGSINLVLSTSGDSAALDLYYTESVGRTEKEIFWAGDGLQIWLQLLFHIWRQMDSDTLILDEPDVYLHPDLQRRLVHILEDLDCQVILATHATEMLAEAGKDSIIIVDRTKRRSKSVTDAAVLSELNSLLGSGFNLQLAKALRARVALFVEGHDMRVLRNVAKTVGAELVAQERGLTVVPMGGASKRKLASSFGWINSTLLDSAVDIHVLIDRDYLDDDAVISVIGEFDSAQVKPHIWKRKELESYLLSETAMSRVSGIPVDKIESYVDEALEELKEQVFGQMLAPRLEVEKRQGVHFSTSFSSYMKVFEGFWANREWRISRAPAKDLISGINRRIQTAGGKPVSARLLSARLYSHEVPAEMRDLLLAINEKLV
ncbi:AAA domain-containing protein, putative AbiEii toxin, Type IV TA system [Amycolatopsis pretoriensis]|uniref:AAA domain-containing protein, putative AbiEii toxin, Type IV TA system n=1 Tax=Amycolatopsis pretoriensis TaxID=218821 RepID=A0A1H5R636_9PSEU|nr:ATP-binding protein [Amycolatopsis pretoriensis]SEF33866.1 AAA domain-containing protein, putative AbiEii toxin, Type IV TA system [Amycolatopsis pretoriensis]